MNWRKSQEETCALVESTLDLGGHGGGRYVAGTENPQIVVVILWTYFFCQPAHGFTILDSVGQFWPKKMFAEIPVCLSLHVDVF